MDDLVVSEPMSPIDPTSFEDLLERYGRALVLYARQFCDEPEDVVQEAFLKLAERSSLPENPGAWLFRVVRHQAISSARATWRRKKREEAVAARCEPWFEPPLDRRLDAQTVTELLLQLDPELREVLVARVWGELTLEQVAELVGCSRSTAHRRYLAALKTLRERLGVLCGDEPDPTSPK